MIHLFIWIEKDYKELNLYQKDLYMVDYEWLNKRGVLWDQYHPFSKTNEVIGCAEHVSRKSDKVLHDHPKTILNILGEKHPKKLKFISCMRIDSEKGWDRMRTMAQMLKDANIDFEWDIYTNSPQQTVMKEFIFHKQRLLEMLNNYFGCSKSKFVDIKLKLQY